MRRLVYALPLVLLVAACTDDSTDSPPVAGTAGPSGAAGSAGATASGGASGASNGAGRGGEAAAGAAGAVAGSAGAGAVAGGAGSSAAGGASWGAAACAPTGDVGFAVGNRIGALSVIDCDTGEPTSIDELCGANATWIFAAHSHCPTCKATAGFTDDVANAYADDGVAIAHILYDDVNVSCAAWKTGYVLGGLPNVKVYEDPTGAVWAALKTSNYTAPSAFLDRNRVITHKEHGLTRSGVETQLKLALSK